MSYTETTSISWFSKLKNALWKIIIGFILIILAIYFLFTNEKRAIETYLSLVEGAGMVISVDAEKIDPVNEGKLVHISGAVRTQADITDPDFGITAPGALAISRVVEMYQWVEKKDSKTEKNIGGSEETVTTYTYEKEWQSKPVDSSDFRQADSHRNPPFAIKQSTVTAEKVKVGSFVMEGGQVAALGDEKPIALGETELQAMQAALATTKPFRLDRGGLYLGVSVTSPQIGDMKIRYERTDLAEASFVGAQSGDNIRDFKSGNGRSIFLSAAGRTGAAAMFDQAQAENTMLTWIIRIAGLIAIFAGFQMIFSLLGVIGDIIPFIGSVVRTGTSLVSLVLTLVIGPVVIAIGWIAFRPVLAFSVIGAGLLLAALFIILRRKKAPSAAAPAAPVG